MRIFSQKIVKCICAIVIHLISCSLMAQSSHSSSFNLPNIVIIYADDLGYGDVQSYNPDRGKIFTPNIDRLTAEGMSFTDAHSSSAVCSPSRYTLLTGRYHWRTRLQSGIVGLYEEPLITPDRLTIAALANKTATRQSVSVNGTWAGSGLFPKKKWICSGREKRT